MNSVFEKSFEKEGMEIINYSTKPSPFNAILWSTNAESDSNFHIGYYSLLDKKEDIDYFKFAKNEHLLDGWRDEEMVQRALKISQGFYTVESGGEDDTLLINDLRFGQMGMTDPNAPFVFQYKFYRENGELKFVDVRKKNEEQMSSEDGQKMLGKMFSELWVRIKGI